MEATRTLFALMLVGAASACGSTQTSTSYRYTGHDPATLQDVDIRPGAMPEGETFSGVYHSAEIGEVTLEQTGETVVGSYEYDRASCHARGHIEGEANGNLVRFHWTEDQRQCGIMNVPPGRGYFLFWKDSAHNGRVTGEWGYAESESGGGRWALFRMPNRGRSGGARPATENSTAGGSIPTSDGASGGSSGGTSGSSGTGASRPSGDPLEGL